MPNGLLVAFICFGERMKLLYSAKCSVEPASWAKGRVPIYDGKQWVKLGPKPITRPGLYTSPAGIGIQRGCSIELKDRGIRN